MSRYTKVKLTYYFLRTVVAFGAPIAMIAEALGAPEPAEVESTDERTACITACGDIFGCDARYYLDYTV